MRNRNRLTRLPANLAVRGAAALLLTGSFAGISPLSIAPTVQAQTAAKVVEGKVFDAGETPLPGAIIYLQDQKTNVIKTFIATENGSYRFGQLPADTDYKIWARYKGDESKSKLISSFDSRLDVTQDFHVGKK